MLKEKEQAVRQAIIILDACVLTVAFLGAFFFRKYFHFFYNLNIFPGSTLTPSLQSSLKDYLVIVIIGVFIWCLALRVNGMYRSMRLHSFGEIVWIIIKSAVLTAVGLSVFIFIFKYTFVSRFVFAGFISGGLILLVLEKIGIFLISHYIRKQGRNYRRILIVGTGKRVAHFISRVKSHPEWGLHVTGVIDDEGGREQRIGGIDVIGKLVDISFIVKRLSIDEVVFIVPRSRLAYIVPAIYDCEILGVKATVAMDLFDLQIAKARHTEFDGVPFLTFDTTPTKEWSLLIKRGADIIVSGIGIALLSPLFLITAILIKATSPGPVFYLSKRIGVNGRKFVMFKFRTMKKGALKEQRELLAKNVMQGPVFKVKNDPRITALGRILRKFSIDELPQLFNVFMGHMSLVGPRPPLHKEVLKYESWQRRRLSMRPGITCLWQVYGRNKISDFNQWMNLDLEYIDNWSLRLDFEILLKTIPVVFVGKGAY